MITAHEARTLSNRYNNTIGLIDIMSKEIEEKAKQGGNTYLTAYTRKIPQEDLKYIKDKFTEAGFECFVGCDPYRNETRIEVRWT